MPIPTLDQLRRALQISEQIESLKANLASFFGGVVDVPTEVLAAPIAKAKKRTMSASGRARIAARWRKKHAEKKREKMKGNIPRSQVSGKQSTNQPAKKAGGLSAEGRARIIAAQKARWAAVKGVKPTTPAKAAPKKKRQLSPEARAKIVAAVKARWARVKKGK